jgi:IS1 family transposase
VNTLSRDQQVQIIAALVEGNSIRSVERMTGVHRDSIMRLGVKVGEGCRRLHDAGMRDLQVSILELDEQWSFIGCKAKRASDEDKKSGERGDCYVFVALDATSKAVVSYVTGKRDGLNTVALATDLRARIVNRPQITADGFAPYPGAIEEAFGDDVDFATLVKEYVTTPGNEAAVRYSPGHIRGVSKTVVTGDPDKSVISTSYVERFNLTTRMQSRRFTRLTSGFSKKLANHRAAIALQFGHYNWCRWHETIRATPAMALGIADHIWTIGELVDAALSAPEAEPMTPAPRPVGMSAGKAKGEKGGGIPKLYIVKGGKGRKK